MKTMIIYMSTHGCTKQVAIELAKKLSGKISIHNLNDDKNPDFRDYERIIIGGSIHAGQIQRRIRQFCDRKLEELTKKEIGLFICCMYEGKQAFLQLSNAFPEKLHQYAKTEAIMGGEFNFDKMRFLEKLVVKKVVNVSQNTNKIDHKAITDFAGRMEKTIAPFISLI